MNTNYSPKAAFSVSHFPSGQRSSLKTFKSGLKWGIKGPSDMGHHPWLTGLYKEIGGHPVPALGFSLLSGRGRWVISCLNFSGERPPLWAGIPRRQVHSPAVRFQHTVYEEEGLCRSGFSLRKNPFSTIEQFWLPSFPYVYPVFSLL